MKSPTEIQAQLFGLFLHNHRKRNNLSLENIGKVIYKTPSQIRLVEKGAQALTQEEQDQIAQLFGFPSFANNLKYQAYFDNLLKKFDNLFFHQQEDEVFALLEKVKSKRSRWEASSLFFITSLFQLIPYRYEKGDETCQTIIKEIEQYTEYMTPFELFFFYSLQGVIAYNACRFQIACSFFEKALSYEKNRVGLYIQLAMTYQTLEYRQKSLTCIYKANQLMLQNPDVYRMLQLSLLYTNYRVEKSISYHKAINERLALYKACLKMKEDSLATSVLHNISYMYLLNEDYMNAIVFAKKSLELDNKSESNCHWFIPYSYWRLEMEKECLLWIRAYESFPNRTSYIFNLCTAIHCFVDGKIEAGIDVLEASHRALLEDQEMDRLVFLLDWLIEMYSQINDLEKMYLCEKEVRTIYERRTEID